MPAIYLTPAQRKEKRAEAHHLSPVAIIGSEGLTASVVKEIKVALQAHGLIKVRVLSDDRTTREAYLASLTEELSAAPIQHIGKLLVLWRPIPPKEALAKEGRMPGPKVVKIVKFSKSGNHRPQIKKVTVVGNMRVTAGGALKRARQRKASIKKTTP
ncbi:MAG: YhbY family RNA-binding protein [Burkholderiales bacterium]|jgi:RNA-binding protein